MIDDIKKSLEKWILDKGISGARFSFCEELSHGDLSTNAALIAAKNNKTSPMVEAEQMALELGGLAGVSKAVAVAPGFVNVFLADSEINSEVVRAGAEGESYGKSHWGEGKKWMIEHTSANPNKALHLGHLRNCVTGMAISNLWEEVGISVTRDYVLNDRGIAIAKIEWGYLKFGRRDGSTEVIDPKFWSEHKEEWLTPNEAKEKADRFVDRMYVSGSQDFEKNKETEDCVRKFVVDWEAGDEANRELANTLVTWALEGQQETLSKLGSRVDLYWKESEHYGEGKSWVRKGLEQGIFKKLEDGAVLSSLEGYRLPDTILEKKDGTSLYITQDIALTALKKNTGADKLFWVVGPEQSMALKQVFAICEQLGMGKREDFTHLSFGYMSVKGRGKMSSRAGTVVYADELLDAAKSELKVVIPEEKFQAADAESLEAIALAAIKYSILKTGRNTDTAFDMEASLDVLGDSGPYLQYSCARAKSILRKAGESGPTTQFTDKVSSIERMLIRYGDIVLRAAQDVAPNMLAQYLMKLAREFNSYYDKTPIIDSGENKSHRLSVVRAFVSIMQSGLRLLGIRSLERM